MIEDEDGRHEHLHVLLTSPSLAGEIVTACISTRRRWSEALVCVHPGDHPFVISESVVPYHFAAIRKCESIEASVKAGKARPKEKASPELLRRMQAGLLDSEFTPPGVCAFYKALSDI